MGTDGSFDEKKREAGVTVQHVAVADKDVDTAAQLAAGLEEELSPEEATRIRKKIDWHILPLMCSEFPLRSLWASLRSRADGMGL